MNPQKLLCVLLMCFGFSLVYAAAQTQPAAGPPATAPTTPASSAKTAVAPLPDPQTPEEFFARARQLSDLEASGIPFHLKATYVASGDAEFTGNGTYEEWWQSKDLWRKEATLGDYKYVAMPNGDKNTVYGNSNYVPLRLRQMLGTVLIRIAPDAGKSSKWKLQHKKLQGVDLAVLSIENPCSERNHEIKCVKQDYFTSEGVLRIRVADTVASIYNRFHEFHGLEIPANVSVATDGAAILDISFVSLEELKPETAKLMAEAPPAAGLQLVTFPITPADAGAVGLNVVPGKLIRQGQPVHPLEAKQQRATGSVVMRAEIDEKGTVREPHVIHSAGPLLDKSALDAVCHWRYLPATIDGTPVSVNTTITVVYKLN
jgi:TonB family protein